MRKLTALALIPLVAVPGPALADGYCRHASYAPTYVAPTYSVPTYHAPTYSVPYADPYAIVVGRAFPFYLPLQSYTSVGDDSREYLRQKNATRDGLLEAMQIANAGGGGLPAPVPGPVPAPVPAPVPGPSPLPGPGPIVPPLTASPKIPSAAGGLPKFTTPQAILTGRCAGCHNPKEPKRVDLSGPIEGIPILRLAYGQTRMTSREMPQNGDMPDAEFDLVNDYISKRLGRELAAAAQK